MILVQAFIFWAGLNAFDARAYGPYTTLEECQLQRQAVESMVNAAGIKVGSGMSELKVSTCKEIKVVSNENPKPLQP